MRLFLYEWITGGGLVEHQGPLPASLLQQGKAMTEALVADAAKLPNCQTTIFRDLRVHALVAPGATVLDIDSRPAHDAQFDQLVAESDAVLIIAPETDNVLTELVKRAEKLGAKLISPGSEFAAIASDKQITAERLTAAGLRLPPAKRIEPDEALPTNHVYPAVIKPILGAGSEDTLVVSSASDQPPAHAWPRRLETFIPGTTVSVSLLMDPQGKNIPLPSTRQRLSDDGKFRYLGGELPLPAGMSHRATNLAQTAIAAMPATQGYVGVDLILGSDPDGHEDYVIEINPRLTTSYIGTRRAVEANLLDAMIRTAHSEPLSREIELKAGEKLLCFDADGSVYHGPAQSDRH